MYYIKQTQGMNERKDQERTKVPVRNQNRLLQRSFLQSQRQYRQLFSPQFSLGPDSYSCKVRCIADWGTYLRNSYRKREMHVLALKDQKAANAGVKQILHQVLDKIDAWQVYIYYVGKNSGFAIVERGREHNKFRSCQRVNETTTTQLK